MTNNGEGEEEGRKAEKEKDEEQHQQVCPWSVLHEGIVLDILSRLPLKSAMCSRCVCKDWNFMISNPYFINLHLSRSPQLGNPDVIFSTTDFIVDGDPAYTKPKVSLRKNLYILENVGCPADEEVKPLPVPSHLSESDIVGSCNGLLCLNASSFEEVIDVYVLNPFTGQNTRLPSETSIPLKPEHTIFGFGFDPVRSEYKVLRLVYHSMKECLADCIVEAEVYTLGSTSWRRIGEAPFSPFGPEHCVYLDGVIHLTAYSVDDEDEVGIASFYVADEELDFEPLIPQMLPVQEETIDIGVLGGCLSLLNYSSLQFAEVWMLTSFFGKETEDGWTRLFALEIDHIVSLNLVCLLKSEEILLLSNGKELLSCHPFGDDARELGLYGMSDTIHPVVHVGSLVSPITGHGAE